MSTYLTRIVEVKLPEIDGEVWKEEKLQEVTKLYDGAVYKVNSDHETPYRIWHPGVEGEDDVTSIPGFWEKAKECKWRWHLVKSWVVKNNWNKEDPSVTIKDDNKNIEIVKNYSFCDNGGSLKYKYLSRMYSSTYGLTDRGFPTDMGDELSDIVNTKLKKDNYYWGFTYVTLNELNNIYNKEQERLKTDLKECFAKKEFNIINDKLDNILTAIKGTSVTTEIPDTEEDSEEDDSESIFEYLMTEDFYDIQCLGDEIANIEFFIDQSYGYINYENIRILYYFS